MIQDFLIIDSHTHSYPTEEKAEKIISAFTSFHKMEPVSVGKGTVADILENMDISGIDYTVLSNFAPQKTLLENNLWTLSEGARHNNLISLVCVHPDMADNIAELLQQYIKAGAKGIKMHTGAQEFMPGNEKLKPVYEFCSDLKFPILFHCGETSRVVTNRYADISMLLPVIKSYPGIPIILAHLAEGKADDVLSISKKYKNVYFDTSITLTGKHCIKRIHDDCWEDDGFASDIIRQVGYEKILFGSDYPFGSPADDISRILRLNLSDEEKGGILGQNAKHFYGL